MDPPKKPKAGIARSLLQRVASNKSDVNDQDDSIDDLSITTSRTNLPTISEPHTMASRSQPHTSNHGASQSISGPASIEQSVRMFRVYENLRKGDTAAISRDIRETTSGLGEAGSRISTSTSTASGGALEGTSILHLAVQCADVPVVEYVLSHSRQVLDVNTKDKDGNTPLHVAAMLSRAPVVRILLAEEGLDDSMMNYQGRMPIDLAKNPDVFQQLQLARSIFIDAKVKEVQDFVRAENYEALEKLLVDPHFQNSVDVNGGELTTDRTISENGGTLLHEAAKKRDAKLIQLLLLNGADPFRRDRKGKLPQDFTKDDRTKAILKKSPAAAAAQRGIQEKTILGSGASQASLAIAPGENALAGKEGREMKGFLKKWVNYTTGYKLRWFVLEDGVLSYYKHQDDAGSACRGAINMKIARLHMDAQDKLRFEIQGKSSVKYHLKANHQVEAKRWFWALNNAIQYAKDEAKEAERVHDRNTELLRQAKLAQVEKVVGKDSEAGSIVNQKHLVTSSKSLTPASSGGLARGTARSMTDDEEGTSVYDTSVAGDDTISKPPNSYGTTAIDPDPEYEEEYGDDVSSNEAHPVNKDAFMIAAQSAKLQLDLLSQISTALHTERTRNPNMPISEPTVVHAMTSYQHAVDNLKGLIGDLGRITMDREAFWHYRLEQEMNVRKVWEENMMRIAQEQEDLENRIGESEEKRKRTKRALKDALENHIATPEVTTPVTLPQERESFVSVATGTGSRKASGAGRRKSTFSDIVDISDSDSDNDEEFFDAVDAGMVEVVEQLPETVSSPKIAPRKPSAAVTSFDSDKRKDIEKSYKGYEEPIRKRLKMDADDRPKISLWGILKSMIGKDMTKMTLPVSFNEPTSLLQRIAEDMEYTDVLDTAAERADSTERMLYVAAFAASEYASTIGRVAKPFNPLLAETYEYVRPDKGYRFFVEQVSHHPPIGAAWGESAKWDYYGESALKSKFYGKSFDINPLGTWFLRLRPSCGDEEELYTWKKVTTSVVGIITGSPTVDNYGPMEIKNHMTGEVCILDFKQRGWKASTAYQVSGKVLDRSGKTRWSIGGRWNDKIYARLTPGYEGTVEPPSGNKSSTGGTANQAFLVWEVHPRPTNIPFSLTPFVVTLNSLTPNLEKHIPPTDTRRRPDQRAMEDGEYDFAATEKNRVEEKQRAKRRAREQSGEVFAPRWFRKAVCQTTGESYWAAKGSREDAGNGIDDASSGVEYWSCRERGDWSSCEDIF